MIVSRKYKNKVINIFQIIKQHHKQSKHLNKKHKKMNLQIHLIQISLNTKYKTNYFHKKVKNLKKDQKNY